MRYPDEFKITLKSPNRKPSQKRMLAVKIFFRVFEWVHVTHSDRWGSGAEYRLQDVNDYNNEFTIRLIRSDK